MALARCAISWPEEDSSFSRFWRFDSRCCKVAPREASSSPAFIRAALAFASSAAEGISSSPIFWAGAGCSNEPQTGQGLPCWSPMARFPAAKRVLPLAAFSSSARNCVSAAWSCTSASLAASAISACLFCRLSFSDKSFCLRRLSSRRAVKRPWRWRSASQFALRFLSSCGGSFKASTALASVSTVAF